MKFAVDPLLPHVRAYYVESDKVSNITDVGRLAQVIDVNRVTAQRWMRGGLSHRHADLAACALGMHPMELWPEWLDDETPDLLLKPDKRSKQPQPPYRPCGTYAAARRHQRNGERYTEPTHRDYCAACHKVIKRRWASQRRNQRLRLEEAA